MAEPRLDFVPRYRRPSDEDILRKELERSESQSPPIFDLPLAHHKTLPVPPPVATPERERCPSRCRYEVVYVASYVNQLEARCDLPVGHPGFHGHAHPQLFERNRWLVWD